MIYRGHCYCGSMQFEVQGQLTQVLVSHNLKRQRRSNLLWLVQRQQLKLASLSQFCHDCGLYPYEHRCDKQSIAMLALDIRCLQLAWPDKLKIVSVSERG